MEAPDSNGGARAHAIEIPGDRSEPSSRRIVWADLRKRVFEMDAFRCPGCAGRLRLLAAIRASTSPRVEDPVLTEG